MRHGEPIILVIDSGKMFKDGQDMYKLSYTFLCKRSMFSKI